MTITRLTNAVKQDISDLIHEGLIYYLSKWENADPEDEEQAEAKYDRMAEVVSFIEKRFKIDDSPNDEQIYKNPELCPCHRCQLARGEEVTVLEHDYCYVIARNIDEEGNYEDDEGNYRNGVTHEVIA